MGHLSEYVGVRLSPVDKRRLVYLCGMKGVDASSLIRGILRREYALCCLGGEEDEVGSESDGRWGGA